MTLSIHAKVNTNKAESSLFLPNFCDVYTVFLAVVLTELLAFMLILVPLSNKGYNWSYVKEYLVTDLAMVSLFLQWVTLLSVSLLCLVRRSLSQLNSDVLTGLFSYLLILVVTDVVSEVAWYLDEFSLFQYPTFSLGHQLFLLRNLAFSLCVGVLIVVIASRYGFWKNSTLLFSCAMVIVAVLVLSELASFLVTPPALRQQAALHLLFLLRNLGISTIISAIVLRYFYMQYHWKRGTEAYARARIQALQARIRPHFLFNTINTIASLIRFQPDKAEQALEDFAELFRASLSKTKLVTLQEEWALCQHYLRIETLRLEERLQVTWNIDRLPQDALLPPLCLQPLLENAIYYGIQSLPQGGTIRVTGLFDGKYIKIDIENPVPDIPSSSQGHRMAQRNIQQRLQAYYGTQAYLQVYPSMNTYQASLYFPYQNQRYENSYCR